MKNDIFPLRRKRSDITMKKKYIPADIEIILLQASDIIATSDETETINPKNDPAGD